MINDQFGIASKFVPRRSPNKFYQLGKVGNWFRSSIRRDPRKFFSSPRETYKLSKQTNVTIQRTIVSLVFKLKTKSSKMEKTEKKFSKLRIYQIIGVVQGDYDDRIHGIRRKPIFYLRSLAVFLLTNIVVLKIMASSIFIDQNDPIQFFLASWFNFLKPDGFHSARFYVGIW